MFYTFSDVIRLCRTFRSLPCEVGEELRGWSWNIPPLLYPYNVQISISDMSSGFCESGRFIYLRYVLREKSKENWRLMLGKAIHSIISEASRLAKSLILNYTVNPESFKNEFSNYGKSILSKIKDQFKEIKQLELIFDLLWKRANDTFSSELAKTQSRSPYLSPDGISSIVVPFITEFPLDGSLIGLSKTLRADLMIYPNIIVEIKTREWRSDYELGITGYALAFESQYEVPVNYGVIVLFRLDLEKLDIKIYEKIIKITDGLRQTFIDRRDLYAKLIEESIDPGKAKRCSPDCPYLHICKEVG
ncbi:MAG: type I-A CRISPR-associated protein Cas4/Csa1 [Candidatus Methanomethyliaceae archaeon]|nr:type I-A CRISPR-associated protein Cas4/Csa1 [Candidatus Methanomethyliaceae archaeon]